MDVQPPSTLSVVLMETLMTTFVFWRSKVLLLGKGNLLQYYIMAHVKVRISPYFITFFSAGYLYFVNITMRITQLKR